MSVMFLTNRLAVSCFLFLLFAQIVQGQDVKVNYSKNNIALNEYFTITIKVSDTRLQDYSGFPEIDGFLKRGTSSNSSTTYTNGKMSSSQSITQNYQATKEGTFELKPFRIKINDQTLNVSGTTITVGPAKQQRQRTQTDPFGRNEPQEYIEVEAEAFLALTTSKSEVYVGEGFTTTLAFYVAETNKANMRFYDLVNQLTDIVKKIKPESTWEENFDVNNISGEPVTINGKHYNQFKIFQAVYYPLNQESITFPSVDLEMIKYNVAKNPTFFGRNKQQDFETFSSRPKVVKVKPLPAHPLKDRVAVGNYRLAESISALDLKTGQSFNYKFNILGEGNLSAVEAPPIPESGDFDFYAPNMQQDITRSDGQVRGSKSFTYYAIPNEPGQYDLGKLIQWVYFNPSKEKYDTLKSRQIVNVAGESRKNEYIMSTDMGSFYDGLEFENNELDSLDSNKWMRIFANVLIIIILVLSVLIVIRK